MMGRNWNFIPCWCENDAITLENSDLQSLADPQMVNYDSGSPILDTHLRKMKTCVHTKTGTQMFTEALQK